MIKMGINKVSQGENLSIIEIKEVFDEITQGLADESLIASFVTALYSKDLTEDEIAGSILACMDSLKRINLGFDNENLVETILLKNNSNNIVDVLFAIDLISSCVGLGSVRYFIDSHFEDNSTLKLANAFGINIPNDNSQLIDKFEKNNFAYFCLNNQEPYLKYCYSTSKKMPFDNIFLILNKMLNPALVKNQTLFVKKRELVEKYAKVCLLLNNSNSIVVSGAEDFVYASVCGETFVAEAWKNKIFTYNLTPELIGFKRADISDVECENVEHNKEIFLDIFKNKVKNSVYDMIVLNSALTVYIAKKADSIMDALDLVKKIIDDGLVYEKICQLKID